MNHLRLVAPLVALCALLAPALHASQKAPVAPAPVVEGPLVARIVVLGSEISDGAAWTGEVGAAVSLADVVEQSLLVPHAAVVRRTDALAGRDALADLERQARQAKDDKPTLVVALDSLALVVLGAGDDAPRRFERALEALKGIGAPLLVGDLPAWRTLAARTEGGWLAPARLPDETMQARLAERLALFARETRDVVVAPVSRLWTHLERDEPLKLRGNLWGRAWLPDLAAKDRLLPRLDGGIALWILAADALAAARVDAPAAAFVWDARELRRRVWDSRAKEREAVLQAELDKQRGPQRPPPPPPPTPAEVERMKREKRERQGGKDGGGG